MIAHDDDDIDCECEDCEQNRAESAYERSLGECYRGGEYAASVAAEQAWIQRNLK